MPRPTPATAASLALAIAGALAHPALGAGPDETRRNLAPVKDPTPTPAVLRVPLSVGERDMNLLTPDAAESDATLQADPAAPAWRVRARVIVRERAAGGADAAVKGLDPAAALSDAGAPGAAVPGFRLAECVSARAAVALAAALRADPRIAEAYLDSRRPTTLRNLPSDPGVPQQWYLDNTVNPQADLNVLPAWKAGLTGVGVTVGIVESGFNAVHPDLAANFNAAASQDPPSGFPASTDHGTATAGLVAMVAGNGIGGAGVAYGAKVSRQYFGFDTDNAAAFLFRNDLNAVKSNSWGPTDNATLGPISSLELAALETAATTGRGGKGTVIFWAGGNGGSVNDRSDYDQYASNRFSICVGSADNQDRRAQYSEAGSSLLVVATSSFDFGGSGGSGIYSSIGNASTGDGAYTAAFGGTSASSPIAAGVAALMLQANPNLSARDVAHILVSTARRLSPDDESWFRNGAGRWTSDVFGFGAVDAGAAVAAAQGFAPRGPERSWVSVPATVGAPIPDNAAAGLTSTIVVPQRLEIERVQVVLNAPHPRLGDLTIELTSPAGTRSLLALARTDFSPGYQDWTFTSVRHWGESSNGPWTLRVSDQRVGTTGTFTDWSIRIYGPEPACPCDWNGRGGAELQDIFDFLLAWFAGAADFDRDGLTNLTDVFSFLDCWFAGCPG